jgi:hypothetical protein
VHKAVRQFVRNIRRRHPACFTGVRAIEFGARYINGSVRDLFEDSTFYGVDAFEGRNVDHVGLAHEYQVTEHYDVAFSTEMLEHDPHWGASLRAMVQCVRPGGLFFLTCATTGRAEHGLDDYTPDPNYYRNITATDACAVVQPEWFSEWGVEINVLHADLYLWGVRA